ncbi:hypothetical protein A7A78_07315 [Aequorivita soesokkakensis]|uniref:Uncharacterized protein n=1 Tax=Aequorivita soesokkakensis TaxID=1385699 RepID=A0A1A9L9K7_9FLAO|nr:hypothetical protein A7A78_07315 [Aequorivita soesokkakensis]
MAEYYHNIKFSVFLLTAFLKHSIYKTEIIAFFISSCAGHLYKKMLNKFFRSSKQAILVVCQLETVIQF